MIEHAKLNFDENGTPISSAFDDIYFSKHDGIAETEYVFIKHNQLQDRWPVISDQFHIGETGFGTGLNFLVAWQFLNQVNQTRNKPLKLKFTSFEKYPVTQQDLRQALSAWPQLKELADTLIQSYPVAFTDEHVITLQDGLVELNLIIGDVNQRIKDLPSLSGNDGIHAWFLDGFAPSKNPDMWTDNLYKNMARLSAPGATLATFTAAGAVRRGLQAVGFEVKKVKGFGHKREMLSAQLTNETIG